MPNQTYEQRYLNNAEPNLCPACLSSDIEGDMVIIHGREAHQECVCHDCEAEWTDVYTLARLEDCDGFDPAAQVTEQGPQTLEFNTGRPYTEEGQRITATLLETTEDAFGPLYRVRFVDHSRRIPGIVKVRSFTQNAIMREYDACRYEGDYLREGD